MSKKLIILYIFWWSLIFPSLSLNTFTTDITSETISYSDLTTKETRAEILKSAEFTTWFPTF